MNYLHYWLTLSAKPPHWHINDAQTRKASHLCDKILFLGCVCKNIGYKDMHQYILCDFMLQLIGHMSTLSVALRKNHIWCKSSCSFIKLFSAHKKCVDTYFDETHKKLTLLWCFKVLRALCECIKVLPDSSVLCWAKVCNGVLLFSCLATWSYFIKIKNIYLIFKLDVLSF